MESVLTIVNSLEMNELHRAVQENRVEGVKFLVQNGADIANTIDGGQTPLHLSCNLNLPHVTKELLKNKSRDELRQAINAKTVNTGMTALHLALTKNSLENARMLLGHGAQYDIKNNDNQPPQTLTSDKSIGELIVSVVEMFDSIPSGESQKILDRLNSCPRENLASVMYARNSQDCTVLHVAMGKFQLDSVATIIDVRIKNLKQNPWQPGAKLDKLMQHSKDARLRLSRLDKYRHESADLKIESRVKDIVDLLHEAYEFLKAYKEQRDPSFTDQPLLIIIEESLEFFGSWKTSKFIGNNNVHLVLWKSVGFAISMLKLCVIAPMQLLMRLVYTSELLDAAMRNSFASVKKCLTGHPDLNEEDADNHTALRYAFKHENYEMAKLLLRLGADPTSERGRHEEPLLHFALSRMNASEQLFDPEIMQLLFHRASDEKLRGFVDAKTTRKDGESALHWATNKYDLRLVQFLMSKGANYCSTNARGRRPNILNSKIKGLMEFTDRLFDYARDGRVEELIDEMKKVGVPSLLAVTGTRNEQGQTLVEVVELKGHVEAVEQIRELLSSERADCCMRDAVEFFRYGMRDAEPIYCEPTIVPVNDNARA